MIYFKRNNNKMEMAFVGGVVSQLFLINMALKCSNMFLLTQQSCQIYSKKVYRWFILWNKTYPKPIIHLTPSSCFLGTFIQHFYVFSMNLYWKGQICSVCWGTIVPGANHLKSDQCCSSQHDAPHNTQVLVESHPAPIFLFFGLGIYIHVHQDAIL